VVRAPETPIRRCLSIRHDNASKDIVRKQPHELASFAPVPFDQPLAIAERSYLKCDFWTTGKRWQNFSGNSYEQKAPAKNNVAD